MKDGSNIKGQVIGQDREWIQLKKSDQSTISIEKSKVLKVFYRDLSDSEVIDRYKKEMTKINPQLETDSGIDSLDKPKSDLPISTPPTNSGLDGDMLRGLDAQNKQILLLTDEVLALTKEVESQKEKIKKLENYNFGVGPKIVRWGVVKRSAVFPGWGQFYWDEPVWGSLYSTLFVASLVHYNQSWGDFQKEKSKYQDFSLEYLYTSNGLFPLVFFPPVSNKRKDYQKAANTANNAAYLAVGIYLINLIDAFLYRHDRSLADAMGGSEIPDSKSGLEFKTETDSTMAGFGNNPAINSIYKLEYTWRF